MDGASHMKIFYKVMMPLSKPILVFIAVSNFIGPWMDFIFARLVLRTERRKHLPLGCLNLLLGEEIQSLRLSLLALF